MKILNILPNHIGYGFSIDSSTTVDSSLWNIEKQGRYTNIYPKGTYTYIDSTKPNIGSMDLFSPNLNKFLHVGHLRNFILAKALANITNCQPYCLLGASLGEVDGAYNKIQELFKYHKYCPIILRDLNLGKEFEFPFHLEEGTGSFEGCKLWNNIVMIRSNGNPTYSYYEVIFATNYFPEYYLTGAEQQEHFKNLGLGDKHLPMGLVLGKDGKKLKSRTGDAMMLEELLNEIKCNLEETPKKEELTWNIAIGYFLSLSRTTNAVFSLKEWTKTTSPGMYLSYTYARFHNIVQDVKFPTNQLNNEYMDLFAHVLYCQYAEQKAIEKLDPNPLLLATLELAKVMNSWYAKKKVVGADQEYLAYLWTAFTNLEDSMVSLGMFPITNI